MSDSNSTRKGNVVGFGAKSKADCRWSPLKVAFYKALKAAGGSAGSADIATASKGKINAGHARHFGYHGVGGGLIKVERHEDVAGFVFTLTAKGRKVDPDAELAKELAAREKAKVATPKAAAAKAG